MYHISFTHSSVERQLCCFQFLTIMKKVAMIMLCDNLFKYYVDTCLCVCLYIFMCVYEVYVRYLSEEYSLLSL